MSGQHMTSQDDKEKASRSNRIRKAIAPQPDAEAREAEEDSPDPLPGESPNDYIERRTRIEAIRRGKKTSR